MDLIKPFPCFFSLNGIHIFVAGVEVGKIFPNYPIPQILERDLGFHDICDLFAQMLKKLQFF